MATGGGHSQLEEQMGIPTMTKASFISTERNIGEQNLMAKAGHSYNANSGVAIIIGGVCEISTAMPFPQLIF